MYPYPTCSLDAAAAAAVRMKYSQWKLRFGTKRKEESKKGERRRGRELILKANKKSCNAEPTWNIFGNENSQKRGAGGGDKHRHNKWNKAQSCQLSCRECCNICNILRATPNNNNVASQLLLIPTNLSRKSKWGKRHEKPRCSRKADEWRRRRCENYTSNLHYVWVALVGGIKPEQTMQGSSSNSQVLAAKLVFCCPIMISLE